LHGSLGRYFNFAVVMHFNLDINPRFIVQSNVKEI
jgi:hypothetical protein